MGEGKNWLLFLTDWPKLAATVISKFPPFWFLFWTILPLLSAYNPTTPQPTYQTIALVFIIAD